MGQNATFAVIKSGGRQYKAVPGQKLTLELSRLSPLKVGEKVVLSDVIMIASGDGAETQVGDSALTGHTVTAKVTAIKKGPKLVIFKKRRRQRYVKKHGYRSVLTEVLVESIT